MYIKIKINVDLGGGGSSNRNASRDESVKTGDESVETRDESIESNGKHNNHDIILLITYCVPRYYYRM